jgi:hypothetical protein
VHFLLQQCCELSQEEGDHREVMCPQGLERGSGVTMLGSQPRINGVGSSVTLDDFLHLSVPPFSHL